LKSKTTTQTRIANAAFAFAKPATAVKAALAETPVVARTHATAKASSRQQKAVSQEAAFCFFNCFPQRFCV